MRSPLARLSRARSVVCIVACVAASLAPARASATHWIVDQSGAGDFTTIQAALDAGNNGLGWRDSILVQPGIYGEDVTVNNSLPLILVGVGGADLTVVRSLDYPDGSCCLGEATGFTFTHDVQFHARYTEVLMRGCVFLGIVDGPGSRVRFENCDFYDRATFVPLESAGGEGAIRNSRFHAAPLSIQTGDAGDIEVRNCSFVGPVDTLLFIPHISQSNYLHVVGCHFEDARYAVVMGDGAYGGYFVSECSFLGLSEAAVWHDEPSIGPPSWSK